MVRFTCNRSPGFPSAGALRSKMATSWTACLTIRERLALRTPAVGLDPVTMMVKDPIGETGPVEMLSCESKGGSPLEGLRSNFSPSGICLRERSTGPATPRDRLTDTARDMFVPWGRDALVWLREILYSKQLLD